MVLNQLITSVDAPCFILRAMIIPGYHGSSNMKYSIGENSWFWTYQLGPVTEWISMSFTWSPEPCSSHQHHQGKHQVHQVTWASCTACRHRDLFRRGWRCDAVPPTSHSWRLSDLHGWSAPWLMKYGILQNKRKIISKTYVYIYIYIDIYKCVYMYTSHGWI